MTSERIPGAIWFQPNRLASAAPVGDRADRTLGLRHCVVRDSLDPDDDPFGLGSPRFPNDWARVDLVQRFDNWLHRQAFAIGTHAALRNVAEDFSGYLDDNLLTLHACTEYDLRLYLYDWLPRSAGPRGPRPGTVIESLGRFFEYLETHEGVRYPWGRALLAQHGVLETRMEDVPRARLDDPVMVAWRRELFEDLDARVFLPDPGIAGGGEWLRAGVVPLEDGEEDEWALSLLFEVYDELARRWLVWREEVIAAGITEPVRARAILERRQREWETRPHPGLWNETPAQAIRKRGQDHRS